MKRFIPTAIIAGGLFVTAATGQDSTTTTTTTTTHYQLCSAIHGARIRTTDSEEVGTIEDVLIDTHEGRIVTIVTSVEERLIPVPWTAVSVSEDMRIITVNTTRETLVAAPTIERSQIRTFSPE